MKVPYSSFRINPTTTKEAAKKKSTPSKEKPKKSAPKKSTTASKEKVDEKPKRRRKTKKPPRKEPAKQLKPNDLVEYTMIDFDGQVLSKSIHLVLDYSFEREPERINDYPTLEFIDGQLVSNNIFFLGDERLEIKKLNDTHKLDMKYNNGELKWKLTKKAKG